MLLTALLPLTAAIARAQNVQDTGDVTIHANPRLAVLLRKSHSYVRLITPEPQPPAPPRAPDLTDAHLGPTGLVHRDHSTFYNGKGYRVQIYYGPSREKALSIKADFMRRNPGVRTYITYTAPSFRVRVGNYRQRSDAEGMLREASSTYSTPPMIVPDNVSISNR